MYVLIGSRRLDSSRCGWLRMSTSSQKLRIAINWNASKTRYAIGPRK